MNRALALLAFAAIATWGCKHKPTHDGEEEFVDIGIIDATTDPAPGVHAPIARGDLAAVAATGRWIDQAHRALELADAAVVERMGSIANDIVLPLVDIDPGGTSGQVIFVRWPNSKIDAASLRAAQAERWVLVALMLDPPRVVDVELLHGTVARGSAEERRVDALLVAGAALQREAAGQAFYTADRFVVEPVVEKKRQSRVVAVIYALAHGAEGPDYELAVDEPPTRGKDKPPPLVRAELIHPRGTLQADPVLVRWPDPHPLTVARALERGRDAAPFSVRAQSGLYSVAATDGRVERVGP